MTRPTELDRLLAGWLHGSGCTCPHAVEPPDLERAADLLAMLAMNGWRIVPATVCAFCGLPWPCTPDEHRGAILQAEELDPGAEWNIAGVDR